MCLTWNKAWTGSLLETGHLKRPFGYRSSYRPFATQMFLFHTWSGSVNSVTILDGDRNRLDLDIQECFQSLERELSVSAGSSVTWYKKSIKTCFVSGWKLFVYSVTTNVRVVSQAHLDFLYDIRSDAFLSFCFSRYIYITVGLHADSVHWACDKQGAQWCIVSSARTLLLEVKYTKEK